MMFFIVSAGWNHWSEWTVCGVEDLQYRHRQCQIDHPSNEECQGHRIETSNCEYIPFSKYAFGYNWKCEKVLFYL